MPLWHIADARLVVELREWRPEEDDVTAEVLGQAEQPLDEGGLARAVRAEQGDDLTARDGQVDVVDNGAIGIPEGCRPQRDERGVY